jgi:arylsulfatase A-like enzyme/Flp pilus assembly protein TadD
VTARFRTTVAILALAGTLACERGENAQPSSTAEAKPATSAASPRPRAGSVNLLLVTLDTTRADRLGCYGDRRAETPTLDGLAREGVVFDQAVAVAPVTLPSHASILTGLYPPRHGCRDNSDFRLPERETTLAEHLAAQGYATEAVVAAFVLSGALGLAQGFDGYDEPSAAPRAGVAAGAAVRFEGHLERGARAVTDAAIAALGRAGTKPFFLWVHYYDPHQPYAPPSPWAERFRDRPYEGEIAATDAELGRLVAELRRRGDLDRTLVVVTADHGESLGDHGEETHGVFLYDSALKVPLLLRLPGTIPAGARSGVVTSGVDIVPTVLDLMGLPPIEGAHGRSIAAAARGQEQPPGDPVYAEAIYPERVYGWAPTFCLRDASTKFIEAPEPEIYDLAADPGERRNLASSRPADVARFRDRLEAVRASFGSADASAESPMDEEQREKLESLGYVSGGSGPIARTSRPDPKRVVGLNQKFVRATALVSEGRPQDALPLLREILSADPENPAALTLAGSLEFSSGSRERALRDLEEAARLAPSVYDNQWNLANAAHIAGRLPEAVRAYRAALAAQPHSVDARYGLGRALLASGDAPGAIREYRDAIGAGVAAPKIHMGLGLSLAAAGDREGARAELSRAVAEDPSLAEAWNKLGILAAQAGNNQDALASFGKALAADPDHADALYNHARASMLLGDRATAERDLARLEAKHPGFPSAWYLKAHLRIAAGDRAGARAIVSAFLSRPGGDPQQVQQAREMLAKLGG